MLTFISHIVLTSVDLPTLGLPMRDTVAHLTSLSSSLSISIQLYLIAMSEEKKKENPADPSLNDRLMKTRSIMLTGEISKESADVIIRNLLVMDSESGDPITVYINSPGGDVDAGFAIYDMVRFISSPVRMVGMGLVASAAVIVLLSVPRERRFGLPNSTYLIHQPMASMKGVAADIEIHARNMEYCRQRTDSLIAEACGKSVEDVRKDTERDCWIYSQGAVEYGLIDRVITTRSALD